ncbi:hypothetical protein BD626DRAFT_272610 [Schizophyllum amplum]|uniref:Uncharacterized protein n=1 Tax=Schizophyllum amplum TaxID=97359 RepID=A0A550CFF4_9AGAR|nr:hypothetical protein BD626DRAFT_272610 [Auriculariopsis ampla]
MWGRVLTHTPLGSVSARAVAATGLPVTSFSSSPLMGVRGDDVKTTGTVLTCRRTRGASSCAAAYHEASGVGERPVIRRATPRCLPDR